MGNTIIQFRRLFSPSASPATLGNTSDCTYKPISSLEIEEEDHKEPHPQVTKSQQQEQATVDDEGDHILEVNFNTDHNRLCKAKLAHDNMLGKLDAALTNKALTATEDPHLDTKALTAKLDEVSKLVDLDVSTILAKQIKVPVPGIVPSWIHKGNSPDYKSTEIQQSKVLLRYCQERYRLLIEAEGQLLCYNEPLDELDEENFRICLPLSLFLACFRLGHYKEMGGHMGATKTYANAKRFYYWPVCLTGFVL